MKKKLFAIITLFVLAAAVASPLLAQNSKPRKESKIRYQLGPVMLGTNHVYFIFYGNWAAQQTAQAIITDFVVSLGGSAYYNINTTYHDSAGTPLLNSILWGSNVDDAYSHGTNLTEADVAGIVSSAIAAEQLPHDPQGLYFVVASDDVNLTGLCTDRCELHSSTTIFGIRITYAFIGNPRRCPNTCAAQLTGPNGDFAADAIINWVAHDIAGIVTNPEGTGWFDRFGKENSDKCKGTFGPTYQTPNGGLANIKLGGRDYLVQMNWVNEGNGYCALAYP